MATACRRIGALFAVTAAALAAFAITHTAATDTGTSTRADSVWSVPADTPTAPATGTPIAAPRDSVW